MEHEDETTEIKKKSNKCQNKSEARAAETTADDCQKLSANTTKMIVLMKRPGVDVTAESLLSNGNFEVL